ncbi:hypothetical protein RB195_023301 [Necator americanus]|uniref:Uncharacterized protein n=1 Tax=Necator americanus TaxID=51031 RepID=A0ABR1EIL2_NECAM
MSDVSNSFSAWETLPEDEPPLCIAVRCPVSPPRHYEAYATVPPPFQLLPPPRRFEKPIWLETIVDWRSHDIPSVWYACRDFVCLTTTNKAMN